MATASVLTRYMREWGLAITTPVAANLITGLVTDTLGFRTANTTPETLRQAADLVQTDQVFAWTLTLVGLMIFVESLVLKPLERRLFSWRERPSS